MDFLTHGSSKMADINHSNVSRNELYPFLSKAVSCLFSPKGRRWYCMTVGPDPEWFSDCHMTVGVVNIRREHLRVIVIHSK